MGAWNNRSILQTAASFAAIVFIFRDGSSLRSWIRFSLWAGGFAGWLLINAPAQAQQRPLVPAQLSDKASGTVLQAQSIRGTPDQQTIAQGDAELQHEGITIRADQLTFDQRNSTARAVGNVVVTHNGDTFSGPELQLQIETYQGFFLTPRYVLGRNGASGQALRTDFLDQQRSVSLEGTYSTCTPDDDGQRDWQLSAKRLRLDYEKNVGVAEGAVLRFMNVPILAAPSLSFPLGKERKSGWLPPTIEHDSRNGPQVSAPYYWNIAPHMDATLAPQILSRRGAGLNSQFRYLGSDSEGNFTTNWVPNDRLAARSRYGLNLSNGVRITDTTQLNLSVLRVSDDDYWKDFHRGVGNLTPRLLRSDLSATRTDADWSTYARIQTWQVLQSTNLAEAIEAPYQRTPQIGARTEQLFGNGLKVEFEGEFNRFNNPVGTTAAQHPTGARLHSLASISRPWITPAWSLTPKLSFNAAAYAMDDDFTTGRYAGRTNASRLIPTASLDNGWVLERDSQWFGNAMRQTLEPRVVYSYTPYRDQTGLPTFDSAPIDFTFDSIFFNNPFSGVDRVADSHQVTAGLSTRLIDGNTGAEALRLGLVQRYLLSEQRITPDGTPSKQRFSDVFLLGSTNVIPSTGLNATLQYNPELARVQRSVVGASYSPGPQRTLGLGYNSDRVGRSEQVTLGWQWPVYGPASPSQRPLWAAPASGAGRACGGTWYSVGRVSMNTRDNKVIDSILGMEYDGGCWIGRVIGRRQSTGINEYVTGIGLQLELVGLSRLGYGANPTQLLKENLGGYQPLRN